MNETSSPEMMREMGKAYFFGHHGDKEKRKEGLRLIIEAKKKNDPEATYLVARLLLDGMLSTPSADPVEHALILMRTSANRGCIQARAYLNAYCEKRYLQEFDALQTRGGELVDFDGVPIRVSRKGVFTPIDAELTHTDGHNILTLSTNVLFAYTKDFYDVADPHLFEKAVLAGLFAWQGEYEVFGGQKLTVKVHITTHMNWYDNLVVLPVTKRYGELLQSVNGAIGGKKGKGRVEKLIASKRSFATSGFRWSVHSRKNIYIQSQSDKFDDYDEIMHVSKHEFGHALGLGDLYSSVEDELTGVEKGVYTELDSYAIHDKLYNLVMCDHHGPISNNDIEMVVLAFRDNKEQLFQVQHGRDKISIALGKGN